MPKAWDHLPNAKYIDLVLESLTANPSEWNTAWYAARTAARDAAWSAAWYTASAAARNTARGAAWDASADAAQTAAQTAAWNTAWYAIAALVAYDDCAHMLDSDLDDLRILSKLGSHAATLMIPAATAFKSIREKELVVL